MLPAFFDCGSVVHYEFLLPGQTVNEEYYVGVVKAMKAMKYFSKQVEALTGRNMTHMKSGPIRILFVSVHPGLKTPWRAKFYLNILKMTTCRREYKTTR